MLLLIFFPEIPFLILLFEALLLNEDSRWLLFSLAKLEWVLPSLLSLLELFSIRLQCFCFLTTLEDNSLFLIIYLVSFNFKIGSYFFILTPSATTNFSPHAIWVTYFPFSVKIGYGCTLGSLSPTPNSPYIFLPQLQTSPLSSIAIPMSFANLISFTKLLIVMIF